MTWNFEFEEMSNLEIDNKYIFRLCLLILSERRSHDDIWIQQLSHIYINWKNRIYFFLACDSQQVNLFTHSSVLLFISANIDYFQLNNLFADIFSMEFYRNLKLKLFSCWKCRRCRVIIIMCGWRTAQWSLCKLSILPRFIFEISRISISWSCDESENPGCCVNCGGNQNNHQWSDEVDNRDDANRCNFKGQPRNCVELFRNMKQIEHECCNRLEQPQTDGCPEKSSSPGRWYDYHADYSEHYHADIEFTMNGPQVIRCEANFRINWAFIRHSTMEYW